MSGTDPMSMVEDAHFCWRRRHLAREYFSCLLPLVGTGASVFENDHRMLWKGGKSRVEDADICRRRCRFSDQTTMEEGDEARVEDAHVCRRRRHFVHRTGCRA